MGDIELFCAFNIGQLKLCCVFAMFATVECAHTSSFLRSHVPTLSHLHSTALEL
jgi:hypothetical protein